MGIHGLLQANLATLKLLDDRLRHFEAGMHTLQEIAHTMANQADRFDTDLAAFEAGIAQLKTDSAAIADTIANLNARLAAGQDVTKQLDKFESDVQDFNNAVQSLPSSAPAPDPVPAPAPDPAPVA